MRKTFKYLIFFLLLFVIISSASEFENYMKQGILYFNSGDYERAKSYFENALIIKNSDLNARYNLAVCHFKLKNYSKALEETNFILKIYPSDQPSLKLLNEIKQSSIRELQLKIDNFKYEEKWYLDLINIYYLNREYKKALQIIDQALKNIPRSAKSYEFRARIYQAQGDFEKAFENIQKAFDLSPDDPEIFERLKDIVDERVRYGSKKSNDESSSGSVNDLADENYVKANTYMDQKMWNKAEEYIKKAIALSKNNSVYKEKLNEIQISREKVKESSELYIKGKKNYKIGRYLQAVNYIKKSLETTPNNINYLQAFTYIIECYRAVDDHQKTIEYCYKVLEQDKSDIRIWIYLANAYYSIEDYSKSKELFLKIKNDFNDYLSQYPSISSKIEKRLVDLKFKLLIPFLKSFLLYILIFLIVFLIIYNSPIIKKVRNYKKAVSFFRRKSWSDVVDMLEPIINLKYNRNQRAQVNKMLILSYIHLRELDKAEDLLKSSLKIFSEDEELLYYYSMIYLKKDVFTKEAIYSYKIFFQKEPDNPRLLKIIGKYFWERKRNPDFRPVIELFEENKQKILEKIFRIDKEDLEVLNLLAEEYKNKNIYNKNSVKVFSKLLDFDFENIPVHILLARTYLNIGQYEKAIKECKFIFRRDINNDEAHDIFKKSYIGEGNITQVLIEYENLLQIDPGNYIIENNIRELRKIRSSYADTKTIIKEETDEQKFEKAKKLFNMDEINDSITIFNELFGKDFRTRETGFFLTYAYLKKDLLDLAYKQYNLSRFDEELLEKKLKELIYQIGKKLEENNDLEKAVEMYDKICKVDISYKDVFERYENLALNMD